MQSKTGKTKEEKHLLKETVKMERQQEAHKLKRTHRKGKNHINKTGRYFKQYIKEDKGNKNS